MSVAVRGYYTANNAHTAVTSVATTYTGWTGSAPVNGDMVVAVVLCTISGATITKSAGTGTWTIPASNSNTATDAFTSAAAYKTYATGDTAPTFAFGSSSYSYLIFALYSTAGGTVTFDAEGTVAVVTAANATQTPNTATAAYGTDAAIVLNAARYQTSGSAAITMTTPCAGFTAAGIGGYAGATSYYANSVSAYLLYPAGPGTVTPGAETFNEAVACNAYTLLVTENLVSTGGPPAQRGGPPYRRFHRKRQVTWQAQRQSTSPPLELSAFGTFSGVSPGDTIVGLTVAVSQFASDIRMGPPTVELWDDSGTPTLLGTGQGAQTISQANVDSFTYTGITYAQLATLRVRIYAHQGTAPSGAIWNVNWAGLTAIISAAPNTAGLASGTGSAKNAQAAVAVTAIAATGTGAAQSPAATTAANVTSVAASGAGAAQPPVAAIGANAAAATGTGTSQSPSLTTAASVTAAAAAGTGAAPAPAAAVGADAVLASGAGAAQNATASTTSSGTASAVLASGTGTAQSPVAAAGVNAAAATGTGAAQNPAAAAAVTAVLATGAGAAQSPVAAIGVDAATATGTGAAQNPAITAAASVPAVAAAGTGAAQGATPATGVNAAAAAGTGAAPGPAVTAAASTATVLASGAGTALNASASTASSGTSNAVLAAGTGTAQSVTPAVAVNTTLASGTGTAQNATVSTAAFTNAQAALATGTGAALNAGATLAAAIPATLASGAGAAAQSAPGIGAPAANAAAAGTARNATGQAGWNAQAIPATAAGTAPAPALAIAAQAAAAQALGAALAVTALGAPAFTVGTLTATDAPATVLTASSDAPLATLTATDGTGGLQMSRYPLNQPVRISATVRDTSGALTDPGTLTLLVKTAQDDGTWLTTGTYATPTRDSLGTYHVDIPAADLAATGHYQYTWTSTGTGAGVSFGDFDVFDPFQVAVLPLQDAKDMLNIPQTDTSHDTELQAWIASIESSLERATGGPITNRQISERVEATSGYTVLAVRQRPLVSLISVINVGSALPLPLDDMTDLDINAGTIRRRLGWPFFGPFYQWQPIFYVTYVAGWGVSVPAAFNTFARIVVQHLWMTQRGPVAMPMTSEEDVAVPGFSYAIPMRAAELLNGSQDGIPFVLEAYV